MFDLSFVLVEFVYFCYKTAHGASSIYWHGALCSEDLHWQRARAKECTFFNVSCFCIFMRVLPLIAAQNNTQIKHCFFVGFFFLTIVTC